MRTAAGGSRIVDYLLAGTGRQGDWLVSQRELPRPKKEILLTTEGQSEAEKLFAIMQLYMHSQIIVS